MHVAIIMDGNGRWALERGLPRSAGHAEGAQAVRRTVEAAVRAGIGTLTLHAFSSDNWGRPPAEVAALMKLFERYLRSETRRCLAQGVRINVVGRRDRLNPALIESIERSEEATSACGRMHLRIAVDYSSRHNILLAARARPPAWLEFPDFKVLLDATNHSLDTDDVDLLIRTGGELRLSDFMLWECAYAELYFSEKYWPEFGEPELQQALAEFGRRQRRFGKLPELRAQA